MASENTSELKIDEYTEKSIVVTGNTKKYLQSLKDLGGLYNARLKVGPGWIFAKNKRAEIEKFISQIGGESQENSIPSEMKSKAISTKPYISINDRVAKLEQQVEFLLGELAKLTTVKDLQEESEDDKPVNTPRLIKRKP